MGDDYAGNLSCVSERLTGNRVDRDTVVWVRTAAVAVLMALH